MIQDIILPSKPEIIHEDKTSGTYEIDGLYPGYGHTLGNSLRRIILSSLPGAAVTHVKIRGIEHEFSVIDGIKEDVISILLNLKKLRMRLLTDEPQLLSLTVKGIKEVTANDIDITGQVEIMNPDLHIASLTEKNSQISVDISVEKGLGYVPKEIIEKDRVEIGSIALDAVFTPVRKANYEVENMRVGDRTDFNRLRISIETDGTISPNEALEKSITLMIQQLKAIVGFKDDEPKDIKKTTAENDSGRRKDDEEKKKIEGKPESDSELMKTRIEILGMSSRTIKALSNVNIRTLGGLARKKEADIMDIDGLGAKGMQEIKKLLAEHGIVLKQ